MRNSKFSTLTDFEGKFKLKIPIERFDKNLALELNSLGFKELITQVKSYELLYQKEFKMCLEEAIMGEVVVVSVKKSWWKFLKW